MNRKYNLKKDVEDSRDYRISHVEEDLITLPKSVDLRDRSPLVFDQGSQSSCTANAGALARMILTNIKNALSRAFLYFRIREIDGDTSVDNGSSIRNIVKALQKSGCCTDKTMPYDENDYTTSPSDIANKEAEQYKITAYRRISTDNKTTLSEIKKYLSLKKQPIVFGIAIYESFEGNNVARTGFVPIPQPDNGDTLRGYHAVTCLGYDDNLSAKVAKSNFSILDFFSCIFGFSKKTGFFSKKGYLICQNSWGSSWGDSGMFYLPYDFLEEYAFDFWTLE